MAGAAEPSQTHPTNNLDFMRFAAAMAVLISHCYPLFDKSRVDPVQELTGWQTLGGLAVDVFFIISGFLIAQSWSRDPNAIRFLKRRALRILPALYAFFLIGTFIAGPILTALPFSAYFSAANISSFLGQFGIFWLLTSLPGVFDHNPYPGYFDGSLWSIRVEVACYAAAVLFGVSGLFSRKWAVTAVAALTFGLYVYCIYFAPAPHVFLNMELRMSADVTAYFFAGAALYFWWPQIPRLHGAYAMMIFAIGVALGGFNLPVVFHLVLPLLIMSMAFHPTARLSKFGGTGDYSYGIYIYAYPITQTIMYLFGQSITLPGLMLLSTAATLLCAFLSWHFIEKPSLALKPAGRRTQSFNPPAEVAAIPL